MNWSTRLRRWVRIRTPPVREASMKPTAATVLPAPVACSNQKRRLAPGSSGASATASASSSSSGSSQSCGSSSGAEHARRPRRARRRRRCRSPPSPLASAVGLAVAAVLARSGPPRSSSSATIAASVPESASTWWSLSSAPSSSSARPRRAGARARAAASSCGATRSDGASAPLLELGERGVDRAAAGRCRARGRRSSRPRAGSARGRTPALDRGRPRSARQPRSRLRQWYWPWARGCGPALAVDPGTETASEVSSEEAGAGPSIPSGRTDIPPRSKNNGTRGY